VVGLGGSAEALVDIYTDGGDVTLPWGALLDAVAGQVRDALAAL
jgi:hypothetical protein